MQSLTYYLGWKIMICLPLVASQENFTQFYPLTQFCNYRRLGCFIVLVHLGVIYLLVTSTARLWRFPLMSVVAGIYSVVRSFGQLRRIVRGRSRFGLLTAFAHAW